MQRFFGWKYTKFSTTCTRSKFASMASGHNSSNDESKSAQSDLTKYQTKENRPKLGLGCLITRPNKKTKELEFLIGKRLNVHGNGMYALPGGHLEYCETWGQCAYRETLEETGLDIKPENWHFAFVCNSLNPPKKSNPLPYLHYVDIIMHANYSDDKEPINVEKHKNEFWKWQSWKDAKKTLPKDLLFSGLRAIIECDDFDPTKSNQICEAISYDTASKLK